ncbi:MAG: serine/threonine-protein kinase [bacterium]
MSSKPPPQPPVPPRIDREAPAEGDNSCAEQEPAEAAGADPLVSDPEALLTAGGLTELSGALEEVTRPSLVLSEEDLEEMSVESEAEDEYEAVLTERVFGRFELLMEMNQGGMATLFLSRIKGPEKFEKLLAIKKIHPHLARRREFINMFLDEARLAALIQNPHVATIFDMGKVGQSYYLAMEYVHGQNLTDILRSVARQRRSLAWPVVARIVADAAAGLHAAHELKSPDGTPLGVVHRDVSPQNVLVSYEGHVKVVDFGIAYAAERVGQTDAGVLKGKVAYMSPEQTYGVGLDRRSDIFSLGILLFEAVCQRRLFKEDNDAASLMKVREAIVPSPRTINPQIPVELERIILKALAKDKAERFSTASELAEQLEELMVTEGQGVSHHKLSKMMNRLFYDKKKLKDRQIKEALEGGYNKAIKAAGMAGTTGTNLEQPQPDSMQVYRQARRSTINIILLGAFFAVVTVILAVYLFTRPRTADSRRVPATRTPPPGSAGPGLPAGSARPSSSMAVQSRTDDRVGPKKRNPVTLRVRVVPEGAASQVVFRGVKYPTSFFRVVVPASDKPENLLVRAPGFHPETLIVVPSEDTMTTVKLRSVGSQAGAMGSGRRIRPIRPRPMREMASDFRDLKDDEQMRPRPRPRPRMATDFRDLGD